VLVLKLHVNLDSVATVADVIRVLSVGFFCTSAEGDRG